MGGEKKIKKNKTSEDYDSQEDNKGKKVRNKRSKNEKKKRKLIFTVLFNHGQCIRNNFDFFRESFADTPLQIESEFISVLKSKILDDKDVMIVQVKYETAWLEEFKINLNRVNDPDNKRHLISVPSTRFFNQIKSLKTNDKVRISQYDNTNELELTLYSGNTSRPVKCKLSDFDVNDDFLVESTVLEQTNSNINIPLEEFTNLCKIQVKSKKEYAPIHMYFYDEGLHIQSENESLVSDGWGNTDGASWEFIVDPYVIKALSKMKNWNDNGTIRSFCQDSKVFRLDTKISTYGEACILVVDHNY